MAYIGRISAALVRVGLEIHCKIIAASVEFLYLVLHTIAFARVSHARHPLDVWSDESKKAHTAHIFQVPHSASEAQECVPVSR